MISRRRRLKNIFQILRSVDEYVMDADERRAFVQAYLDRVPEQGVLDYINALGMRKAGRAVI